MARTILITGATSLIAQHCARIWADGSLDHHFILAGRDDTRLARVAADLQVRAPSADIITQTCDLTDPAAVNGLFAAHAPDIVLIAQGVLPDQTICERDLTAAAASLTVNALSPILCAEAAACGLAARGRGTLAIIGSVAGDRGRRSNYHYGAAKAALAAFAEGLDHRFAGTDVRVLLIKPGPTATPMTAHLTGGKMRLADPEDVARDITRAIGRGQPVLYTPRRWAIIMGVIRHLPRAIFARLPL